MINEFLTEPEILTGKIEARKMTLRLVFEAIICATSSNVGNNAGDSWATGG